MTKQGIDYFSLDVQFEDKVELFLLEKEAIGLSVLITLYQIIYQNEGYYTKNGKDLCLLIKKRINVNINEIESCIKTLLDRDILSHELHDKYNILTSSGIQKRFFDAAKRKKEVRVIPDYVLIGLNEYENIKDVSTKGKDASINATKEKEEVKEEEKEKGKGNKINDDAFEHFWNCYEKKVGKPNAIKEWNKLTEIEKNKVLEILPAYIQSKPEKQYRKDPERFLKHKVFNDEIIKPVAENQKAKETVKQNFTSPIMKELYGK